MKFNSPKTTPQTLAARPDATTNYEGGLAFKASPELELYLRACTCLIEDKAYVKSDEVLADLKKAIHACDRSYVLKLANYTRNQMHLRTLPLVLLAEASAMQTTPQESKSDVRLTVPKVITRADQPAELLAYWIRHVGQGQKAKLPMAIKKGVSDAMLKFNEYHLAKYNRDGAIKLKDVFRMCHPKANSPLQNELYKKVISDSLATPDTWEVYISKNGSSAETWNAIAPKMGIMALVRNLRNFEKHDAEEAIKHAVSVISDPEQVQASKLLPFRWLAAEREVSSNRLKDALRQALNISIMNVAPWAGKTAIFVDLSGSMSDPLSEKSNMSFVDVASLMGAMATKLSSEDYLVGGFGASYADIPISRYDSILTNAKAIKNTDVGHSTNAFLCIEALLHKKESFDRVFIFSDMQCYVSGVSARNIYGDYSLAAKWIEYRRQVNPKAILYSVDLSGHGTLQFPEKENGVVQLAGWSDRVLDLVSAYESALDVPKLIREKY